jgi:hypothetical protein
MTACRGRRPSWLGAAGLVLACQGRPRAAGLTAVDVVLREVDVGLDTAALVRWRLVLPALAQFIAHLSESERAGLHAEAVSDLDRERQPLRPAVRILSSVMPAAR